jgi:hypothetical protein
VNHSIRGVWRAAALAGGLTFLCFSLLAGGEERKETLVGTVIEADWDDDGNVIAVELETDDETISISNRGKGGELLAHVGQRVEVVGTVAVDEEGWEVLFVSSFTLLPSDES